MQKQTAERTVFFYWQKEELSLNKFCAEFMQDLFLYNKPIREAYRHLLLSAIADGEKIDYNIEKELSKRLCEYTV